MLISFPVRFAVTTHYTPGNKEWMTQRLNDVEKIIVSQARQYLPEQLLPPEGFCVEELLASSLCNQAVLEFQFLAQKHHLQYGRAEAQCYLSVNGSGNDQMTLQKLELVLMVYDIEERQKGEILAKNLPQRLWIWNSLKAEKDFRFQVVSS